MSLVVAPLTVTWLLCVQAPPPTDPLTALESALTTAIERAEPSVVAITRLRGPDPNVTYAVRGRPPLAVPRPAGDQPQIADPDYLPMPGDFGSGVVVGKNGEILTAFHVVKGSALIYVRAPGRQAFEAEVIAADPRSDLAVLAPRLYPDRPPPKLTPIALGDGETLRKGSLLVVLGNPFNTARDGKASASWGILSNTTRRILPPRDASPEAQKQAAQAFLHQPTLWQLDARLNLGMSGGAVVNPRGELVGITTTGGNVEGFDAQAGYAIPLDALGRRVLETLLRGQEVEYGFLGISLDRFGPNRIGAHGVVPGTPAAEGDLLVGDVILAVGDRAVTEEGGVSLALSTAPVGRPVKVRVLRNGRELEKSVLVAKYPLAGEVIATNRPAPWRGLRVDYTSAVGATTASEVLLAEMAKGLVSVLEVRSGSPAAEAGLRKGQIITRVNDRPVRTPADFLQAVSGLEGPVTLETDRGLVTIE